MSRHGASRKFRKEKLQSVEDTKNLGLVQIKTQDNETKKGGEVREFEEVVEDGLKKGAEEADTNKTGLVYESSK